MVSREKCVCVCEFVCDCVGALSSMTLRSSVMKMCKDQPHTRTIERVALLQNKL